MARDLEEFRSYRERMNERILAADHLGIKRFINLDTAAYRDGALDGLTNIRKPSLRTATRTGPSDRSTTSRRSTKPRASQTMGRSSRTVVLVSGRA